MLFDPAPKCVRKDLFDRDVEVRRFSESVGGGGVLIVVYGVRRVGKTSLVRVGLRGSGLPHAIIDVRKIYFEFGSVSKAHIYSELARYFSENLGFFSRAEFKIKELVRRLRGFHFSGTGVEVEPSPKISFTDLLSHINDWARKQGTVFALAFDEAQYLRFGGNVKYDGVFAWAVDNLTNLSLIVSGSEIGVLRDFLKLSNPKAPLYGRHVEEIYVDRFSSSKSLSFLRAGFDEAGMKVPDAELRDAVSLLDGIVGWLTLYGYYRVKNKITHKEALQKTFEAGATLVMEELEKLISPSRKRYLAILTAVSAGASTWSQIKSATIARAGYINDKRLSDLLKTLIKHGFLAKINDEYRIPDPVVAYVIKELTKRKRL